MRAVLVSEFGGPEQLRLGQAADPVAGPGQVRIAVHAAGVNPVDAGNRVDGRFETAAELAVDHHLSAVAILTCNRTINSDDLLRYRGIAVRLG